MEQFVEGLGPWVWWILALGLGLIEIFAPGTYFIWLAVAALVTGAAGFFFDPSWEFQLVIFAVLSVVAAVVGRTLYGRRTTGEEESGILNDRLARQIGRVGTVVEPISGGIGRIRLDDTLWRVSGPDVPAGTQVKVVGIAEGRLRVDMTA